MNFELKWWGVIVLTIFYVIILFGHRLIIKDQKKEINILKQQLNLQYEINRTNR